MEVGFSKKKMIKNFLTKSDVNFRKLSFLFAYRPYFSGSVFMVFIKSVTITWHSCLISKRVTHDHAKSKCTFSTNHIIRFKLGSNRCRLILSSNRQAILKVSMNHVYWFFRRFFVLGFFLPGIDFLNDLRRNWLGIESFNLEWTQIFLRLPLTL